MPAAADADRAGAQQPIWLVAVLANHAQSMTLIRAFRCGASRRTLSPPPHPNSSAVHIPVLFRLGVEASRAVPSVASQNHAAMTSRHIE